MLHFSTLLQPILWDILIFYCSRPLRIFWRLPSIYTYDREPAQRVGWLNHAIGHKPLHQPLEGHEGLLQKEGIFLGGNLNLVLKFLFIVVMFLVAPYLRMIQICCSSLKGLLLLGGAILSKASETKFHFHGSKLKCPIQSYQNIKMSHKIGSGNDPENQF